MRGRGPRCRSVVAWAALSALTGCVLGAPAPVGEPVDPSELVAVLEREAQLNAPTRLDFDWSLSEQSARARGMGVARAEPPYRARLDLFLGDGTTVARATLIESALDVAPESLPEGMIPPPNLLWAALGVFRPGSAAPPVSATRVADAYDLRYDVGDGLQLRYHIVGARIRQAELLERGRALHRVELLTEAGERYPREATYRNLSARRQLTLTTRSVENVSSFPSEIWRPGR